MGLAGSLSHCRNDPLPPRTGGLSVTDGPSGWMPEDGSRVRGIADRIARTRIARMSGVFGTRSSERTLDEHPLAGINLHRLRRQVRLRSALSLHVERRCGRSNASQPRGDIPVFGTMPSTKMPPEDGTSSRMPSSFPNAIVAIAAAPHTARQTWPRPES